MQNKIALLYDFDFTLSSGYMQEFGLMQDLGYDDVYSFFRDCDGCYSGDDMDRCLRLMGGTREIAKTKGKRLTYEYLKSFGKDIKYYNGVKEWFKKINAIGKELGYEVEHYVISSGFRELLEGATIAKYFKRIYANFYAYDKEGKAIWPAQVVNYTTKTQYIYRVRKNMLDNLASVDEINRKIPDEEELPFSHMIYLGDSETDIPSFKMIKTRGGRAICVYAPGSEKARNVAERCLKEGRVNHFAPADYRENSELFNYVKDYINSIATSDDE